MAKERVLAVEDEEDIQELISHNLEKEGYVVTVVSSSKQAFRQIKASPQAVTR